MRVQWFNSLRHTNWERLAAIASFMCGAWALWASVVPQKLHILITSILGTLSFTLGFMMRGTKHVEKRAGCDDKG